MLDLFRTLPGLLDDVEGSEAVREAIVFATWRRITDESLAAHVAPIHLEKKRFVVAIPSRMWQKQLENLSGEMIYKLNAALGTSFVTFIEFVIDEKAVKDARSRTNADVDETKLRKLAEKEISPELRSSAEKIQDETLREQFLMAAGNCLVRQKRLGD
jgi:hypothetical protein